MSRNDHKKYDLSLTQRFFISWDSKGNLWPRRRKKIFSYFFQWMICVFEWKALYCKQVDKVSLLTTFGLGSGSDVHRANNDKVKVGKVTNPKQGKAPEWEKTLTIFLGGMQNRFFSFITAFLATRLLFPLFLLFYFVRINKLRVFFKCWMKLYIHVYSKLKSVSFVTWGRAHSMERSHCGVTLTFFSPFGA